MRQRRIVRVASLVLAMMIGTPVAEAQRVYPDRPAMPAGDSTIVITLGTGTPVPEPERAGPATAVVVGSRVFLFDAGPGVMRRIADAGLPIDGVAAAFVTHLHSDHTLGLPDLIFTTWVMGRSAPMRIYGPRGLRRMTDHFMAAWAEDTTVRITGLERARPGGYRVETREVTTGVVYDSGGVRVTAIPVPHGSWDQAFGYRIDTPRRSVVISGDTRASDALTRASSGADVLIVEVYPETRATPEPRPGGELWPRYLREFHISDVEVGRMAAAARPRLLVLSHVLLFGGTEDEILAGIRRGGYRGEVVIARDLQRF